jgi:hypothetical protein
MTKTVGLAAYQLSNITSQKLSAEYKEKSISNNTDDEKI